MANVTRRAKSVEDRNVNRNGPRILSKERKTGGFRVRLEAKGVRINPQPIEPLGVTVASLEPKVF